MFDLDPNQRDARPQSLHGKYAGIVLENGPPEDADHRGELLVEVPGILEETTNGDGEQALQAVAKPCFLPGFFFVPDVGAHVWVEFAAGQIEHPIWTGVWYPVEATPPTSDDEPPTEFQKIIRTSTGHVIQLDDTDGEEKLVVLHKSQSVIAVDKDGHIVVEHKGGAKVEMMDDAVTVTSSDITLDGTVTITGDATVEGDLIVGSSGPKTTISGNEITGG